MILRGNISLGNVSLGINCHAIGDALQIGENPLLLPITGQIRPAVRLDCGNKPQILNSFPGNIRLDYSRVQGFGVKPEISKAIDNRHPP